MKCLVCSWVGDPLASCPACGESSWQEMLPELQLELVPVPKKATRKEKQAKLIALISEPIPRDDGEDR